MDDLYDLFFELSNDTRMGILVQLSAKPMKLTALSKALELPAQEVSRQLSRLEKVQLTTKGVDGLHRLTPYAEHVIKLTSGFSFLASSRDYFEVHTMSGIPLEYLYRVGELRGCESIHDVMLAFHSAEETIRNCEDHIWILSDQVLMSTMPLLEERVAAGASFRLIVPRSLEVSPPIRDYFLRRPRDNPLNSERVRTRYAEAVGAVMIVSEKEVGLLSFPTRDGGFDYKGFRSGGLDALKWAESLFGYYWETSSEHPPEQFMRLLSMRRER